MSSPDRTERILDARTLRALAHPLRMRLLNLLEQDGPATATGLGKRVAESSGTTSWHLRQLADAGLVLEDTERGSKRERWWKAAQDITTIRIADFAGDAELAGPVSMLLHQLVVQRYEEEAQFVAEFPRWRDRWEHNATLASNQLSLTPEETHRLNAEINTVIDRYRREVRPGDDSVVAHWAAFPRTAHPETTESAESVDSTETPEPANTAENSRPEEPS
ncbi:helix-turn-helix domain-containing protein [Amycolatopsis rhabdoformis]|uniref:Helix-turn-helix domain-containing protein n=1 Tax=Amycolatopsis rhabdoformis TaxID=1448059 RepID=A0ABZ1I765_9PSEU|nr:helix-turn-helix domain-containing protein [Amycolatopsis rhabdoformis]WSE30271.1 helix-turn-helix domain-containing protein [Amycolatopsis rhabdoformis]